MRDCVRSRNLQKPIQCSKALVLNQRYRYILDLHLLASGALSAPATAVHGTGNVLAAILEPNVERRVTAWLLERKVFESVRDERGYLDKFVVEIGRVSFQLANGNLFRFFGKTKYRQTNQNEDYFPRPRQQVRQSILTLLLPSHPLAPPLPSQ